MAINVNIAYLKAVRGGALYAQGEPVAVSRRIGTYAIRVTDEAGELVATFQDVAYRRLPDPGPAEPDPPPR